jgi:hypothetical protein
VGWIDGLTDYTAHGLWAPESWRPYNFATTHRQCFNVVQWQDSANGWVTRAPLSTCGDYPWVAYTPSDDGS